MCAVLPPGGHIGAGPGRACGCEVPPVSEQALTATFSLLVVTVLAAYGAELALGLLRWRRGKPAPGGRLRRLVRRTVLAAGTLGVGCVAYGWLVEPGWIEVTHVSLPLSGWPPGAPTARLVLISDLHVEAGAGNEERLPALVAAERPDLIVFTGDAINTPAGAPRFLACMQALAAIAPLHAVRGNWDVFDLGGERVLERSAARLLGGVVTRVPLPGVELTLAGLDYGDDATLPGLLAALPPGGPSIVLTHAPDPILELARGGVGAVLCGHTHGGQVRLPGYGALLTLARHGKRFEAGLYRVERTWLYVNRGLGLEGGAAPRVRFLCRPEITVLTLGPEGAAPR